MKFDELFCLISFHVGSGCQDTAAFVEALQNSRKLFDYAESVGFHFNVLDIGGGFPGTDDVELKFEEVCNITFLFVSGDVQEKHPLQYGNRFFFDLFFC